MKIKNFLSLFIVCFYGSLSFSQNWVEKMQNPTGNFYDVKAEFDKYWLTHDKDEKGKGYKAFKRWENFVERRVYPTGDLSLLNLTTKNYEAFLKQQSSSNTGGKVIGNGGNLTATATWTAMGPLGAISGNAGGQFLKSGRLNFITIDPTNSNNLWVGAPAGGLWKSTNGGTSWTTNTDNLSVIGCSDLAIDPTNTSIMYLATGDGDAGDTRSIGVLKSTDGGATWAATGLTNPITNYFLIRRLIINPSNTQILMAATNSGIWRTNNGGTSWTQVSTSNCYDLEFKPGDPNTVYAGGTSFRVSTNGGSSFTQITSGITTSAGRMAIAVTSHDASYVYVLATNPSNNGFLGLYRSTASGSTFSLMSTTPNVLDWSTNGSGTGGQGWYDLCIASSPLNKDEIVTGGVNVWRSLNGGSSWSLYGHWTGSGGAPFTHADHHDLEYDASGTLFNTNDGTVYKRTGSTWTEISGTMNISQIYKIGLSSLTANKWITGHQDNGTSIWNGSVYSAALGGDGMDCFYDRTNDNNVFGEYQNGAMRRSTNGGLSWSSATSGMTGTAPWVTIWKQDPQTANTLYAGYADLFKSTNLGVSWSTLTAIPASGGIREFAISTNSPQTIYVLKSSGIYKTTNGGTSWTNVTGTVPVGSASPEFITIDPADPNNAWVVLSGYSSGNKVFMTTNGGTTWTNISSNLPNIPANCSVYEPGSNDRIYVGMDVGIYYKDNLSTNWALYNTGLPNVPISDLEISPASPTLLHASTYGRGVWVASVISAALPPVTSFTFAATTKCAGVPVTFTDQSVGTPSASAWNWTVTPGTPTISSSSAQNPTIVFPSGGTYTVSFQASSINGPGAIVSKTVSITNSPVLVVSSSSQTYCGGAPASFTASGASSYSWSNGGGASASATFAPTSASVYTVTGVSNGCSSKKTVTVTTAQSTSINVSGANSICIGSSAMLLASGASSYTWNTSSNSPFILVSPTVTTTYTVDATTANNCKPTAIKTIVVNPLPTIFINGDTLICIDQGAVLNASGADIYTWIPGGQTGNSVSYTPSVTSTYTCTGTDANGCTNSSAITVSVSSCLSSGEFLLNNDLYSVFPNPTKGKLIIKASSFTVNTPVNIEVMDVAGKKVYSQQLIFTSAENSIDISNLAAGSYFVKLSLKNEGSNLIRIIKE